MWLLPCRLQQAPQEEEKYVISGAPYVTAGAAPYVPAGAESNIGASPMQVTAGATAGGAAPDTADGAEDVTGGAP